MQNRKKRYLWARLLWPFCLLLLSFPAVAGASEGSFEDIIEYFDEPEEDIVIIYPQEDEILSPAPTAPPLLPLFPSEEEVLREREIFSSLFALEEEAPLPEGSAYLVAPAFNGLELLPCGTHVEILGRQEEEAFTSLGTLPAGSLSSVWEGDWSAGLTADSPSSARYLATLYGYGLRIPAPLRSILKDYTVELRSQFLDEEVFGEENPHPESILGSILGQLSISPERGWRIEICAIPEQMEWVFFHEFGHALDVCYLAHTGRFLSEDEAFLELIRQEGASFDASLPYLGEHPDGYESLAELIAAFYCEPDLLAFTCPEMYAFASSLETTPVWEWTESLPREEIVIIF